MSENKVKIRIEAEDEASSKLKWIGASFSSLAKIAVGAVGAISIVSGIKASIQAMNDQVRVNTQLEAVLKSTNNAVGLSSQAIQDMASKLQWLTTFQDDTIQAWQNMLLTFTNIGRDVFPMATETLLDMAVAMNGWVTPSAEALSSQAIQLGKALNDPINGISSLARVGVTFTDGQKTMIEWMVKAGDTMSAQKIILAELNREFWGSAQAQAQTFAGKMEQLGNAVGDIAEIIWYALLPALTSIANRLKIVALQAVQFFNDNSQAIGQFASDIQVFFESVIGTMIWAIKSSYDIITEAFSSIFWNAQETWIWMAQVFQFALKSIAMSIQIVSTVSGIVIRSIVDRFRWLANKVRESLLWAVNFLWAVVTWWGVVIEGIINVVIWWINKVLEAVGGTAIDFVTFWTDAFEWFSKEMKAQSEDLTKDMGDNWDDFSKWVSWDISKAVENMDSTFNWFSKQVNSTWISLKWLALDGSMGMNSITGATWKTKDAMKQLSEEAKKIISDITGKVNESRKAVDDARDAIKKKIEEWTKYKQEWVKALSDVTNEIRNLKNEASGIDVKFKTSLDEKLASRYLEIQKEMTQEGADTNALTKERQLIENWVNKAVLDSASSYEKLSATEKIILDIQKEKNLALDENKKKVEALMEKQSLLQIQADQKSIKDLKINADMKDGIITASYTNELGKKQEIHDYENVQLAVQISEKQKAFDDEMATLELNLQNKLAKEKGNLELLRTEYDKHNKYLKDETAITASKMTASLAWVAQSLRDVINLRREAWFQWTPAPVTWASAVWGAVSSWSAYMIWERWPEIFVPNSAWRVVPNKDIWWSGWVVINFGGVTITSDIDLDEFENRIKTAVARATELSKLWIS